MCLILFAFHQREDFPLVVIANRDEFYARPTRSAHWWEDDPGIFGGRDLEASGTWMGVNKNGRFAAITNVREPGVKVQAALSRGDLPRAFLRGSASPHDYLSDVEKKADAYAGFNLLVGDATALWFYSNRSPGIKPLAPGFYGISNAAFDQSWPKLVSGRQALEQALETGVDDAALLRILGDRSQADDAQLPKTGVPLELERLLSSRFIESPEYGTRASSVVKFSRQGQIHFTEQNFDPAQTDIEAQRVTELITIAH